GSRVYAAVFYSGNLTTTISEGAVCDGGSGAAACGSVCAGGANMGATCSANSQCPGSSCASQSPGGLPAPNLNSQMSHGPETGLIVKFDAASSQWRDELDRNWSNAVRFSLPDLDVFALDANAATPAQVQSYSGVGTTIFNMVASPGNPNKVYV